MLVELRRQTGYLGPKCPLRTTKVTHQTRKSIHIETIRLHYDSEANWEGQPDDKKFNSSVDKQVTQDPSAHWEPQRSLTRQESQFILRPTGYFKTQEPIENQKGHPVNNKVNSFWDQQVTHYPSAHWEPQRLHTRQEAPWEPERSTNRQESQLILGPTQ